MNRRIVKLITTGVALLCLATATAWAGLQTKCLCAHLNGVNRCGNLICDSITVEDVNGCATFVALVNTCTHQVTGTATGCVTNESCWPHSYLNNPCFGYINGVCVCSSLYTVCADGKAVLIASGYLCNASS